MYVGHHYADTHTINVNKTCALQQTTGKTGTKHRLCENDFLYTSGTILHRNACANLTFAVFMAYTISMHIITT